MFNTFTDQLIGEKKTRIKPQHIGSRNAGIIIISGHAFVEYIAGNEERVEKIRMHRVKF